MSSPTQQSNLFAAEQLSAAPETIGINARCMVRTKDGHRVVLVAGVPMTHFSVGDRMAEAHAMVMLVEQGWAEQAEVARAFECSTRTVRRSQRRFEEGGMVALGRSAGFPKGRRRLGAARMRRIHELKAQGVSNRAIAEQFGVTEKAVRKLLRRLGWRAPAAEQAELALVGADPNLSAPATPWTEEPAIERACAGSSPQEPAGSSADPNLSAIATDEALPLSFDTDPADRRNDRLFAYLGLLEDAAPMFRSGTRVAHAGVLLAVPALLGSGVLACAHDIYGSIGPAFYGLRTSFVAMLLMVSTAA